MQFQTFFMVCCCALLPARSVLAQWVVTDPASYTYYVEQLRSAASALETAQKTVDGVKQTVSQVKNVNSQLSGMYNRAKGMVEDMKRARDEFDPKGILSKYGASLGIPSDDNGFMDIEKVLSGAFGDARTRGMQGNDIRHDLQQKALKDVINDSEKLLLGVSERLDRTGKLAAQIDTTANIKDSMDLNNRISVEILKTLIDMLAIAVKNNQTQALFSYSGVTDAGTQERQRVLTDASRQMKSVEEVIKTSDPEAWKRMRVGS